jgi:hypothetical protein
MVSFMIQKQKRQWKESLFPSKAGRWASIYVTLNPKGVFHISGQTFQLFGEPDAVKIFFDVANSTIGLQPSRRVVENAYSVIGRGKTRGRIVRAFPFTQEFGLRLDETIRFLAPIIDEDGILNLDLRTVKSAAKPKRAKAAKA